MMIEYPQDNVVRKSLVGGRVFVDALKSTLEDHDEEIADMAIQYLRKTHGPIEGVTA